MAKKTDDSVDTLEKKISEQREVKSITINLR
jgi:hypothetical protein